MTGFIYPSKTMELQNPKNVNRYRVGKRNGFQVSRGGIKGNFNNPSYC
jgi:hypothetical protein